MGPSGTHSVRFTTHQAGGSKSQKSRLRLNAARGHFALLGTHSGRCSQVDRDLPAPPRPRLLLQMWWTLFHHYFASTLGMFIYLTQYLTYMFYTLLWMGEAPLHVARPAGHDSIPVSLFGGEILFWATSIAFPMCRLVWGTWIFIISTNPAHFCVSVVSISFAIYAFH